MLSNSKPSENIWAGIDIGKDYVDFFVLNGKENPRDRRPRRAKELAELAAQLRQWEVCRVVVEATGGYEREVCEALEGGGLEAAVVQPRRIRQYARAAGVEAKTDQLDAHTAACFGAAVQPAATPLPSAEASRYRELPRHLNWLVDERARLRNRLHRVHDEAVADSCRRVADGLSEEIERLEGEVEAALEALPETAAQARRLRTAPGVGPKTAWALTAHLPELGSLNGKQAAALAGLAPRARDSGAWSGRRSIGGGRAPLRRALYLAAWSAVRCDPRLGAFYRRLVAAGKARQLAMIAVARRLLVMLNAMARDQTTWRAPAAS